MYGCDFDDSTDCSDTEEDLDGDELHNYLEAVRDLTFDIESVMNPERDDDARDGANLDAAADTDIAADGRKHRHRRKLPIIWLPR